MAASSSSNFEARLIQIQIDLDEVKTAVNKLETKQIRMQKTRMGMHELGAQRTPRGNLRGQYDEYEGSCQRLRRNREPDGKVREEGRSTAQGAWKDSKDRTLRQAHS